MVQKECDKMKRTKCLTLSICQCAEVDKPCHTIVWKIPNIAMLSQGIPPRFTSKEGLDTNFGCSVFPKDLQFQIISLYTYHFSQQLNK